MQCDLNCDMGEGIGNDELIMPYITSANIACGYHAGDEETMKHVVDLCIKYNVAIGAHPSYSDRENFGRTEMIWDKLRPEDLPGIIIPQLELLQNICTKAGTKLHHVKPHGALYNRSVWDGLVSSFICTSILDFDPSLILYGLHNSELQREAKSYNMRFMNEAFADRTYQDDGSLTPRTQPNALIQNTEEAIKQVLMMVNEGKVRTISGKEIPIVAETICIHGDGEHAVEFAKAISTALSPL